MVGEFIYLYPISGDNSILLLTKFPVPNAISFPASLNKTDSATKRFLDLYFNFPIAVIRPLLAGLIRFMLKEVVRTKASATIEFTAKKEASSNNLKYTDP